MRTNEKSFSPSSLLGGPLWLVRGDDIQPDNRPRGLCQHYPVATSCSRQSDLRTTWWLGPWSSHQCASGILWLLPGPVSLTFPSLWAARTKEEESAEERCPEEAHQENTWNTESFESQAGSLAQHTWMDSLTIIQGVLKNALSILPFCETGFDVMWPLIAI